MMKAMVSFLSMGGVCLALGGAGVCAAAAPAYEKLLPWFERSNGVYSLFEAARAGDVAVLKARLEEKDAPNAINELGDSPLHLAAAEGRVEIVELLLQAGADALQKNRAGKIASELAKDEATREACRAGEALRFRELKLFPAVRADKVEVVSEALKQGVSPNALSEDNALCLLGVALEAGALQSLKVLLAAGAKADYVQPNGKSLLHLAAGLGRAEAIPLLLAAGADPMHRAGNGATALHDAIWSGRTAAALALIPAYQPQGFNPDGWGNGYPVTMAIWRGNLAVVRGLLEAGLNPNDPAFAAEPLLVVAVRNNRPEMVELLLRAGADKNARDAAGKSAVDYATGAVAELLR